MSRITGKAMVESAIRIRNCRFVVTRSYKSNFGVIGGGGGGNIVDGIINCRRIAAAVDTVVAHKVDEMRRRQQPAPFLSILCEGGEPESVQFADRVEESCKRVGIRTFNYKLAEYTTRMELQELLVHISKHNDIDACLVALPLRNNNNDDRLKQIAANLCPDKNVDAIGVHPQSLTIHYPVKVSAALQVLQSCSIATVRKTTLLHGTSRHLAFLKHLITEGGAGKGRRTTVVETDLQTPVDQLREIALTADLIVTDAGLANSITADMIKNGCHVIDLAQNQVADDDGRIRMTGDVQIEQVKQVAAGVTPVPNGIAPLSLAAVGAQTLLTCYLNRPSKM